MKKSIKLGFELFLVILIFLGFGYKNIISEKDEYSSIEKLKQKKNNDITGEELFLKNCSACHGIDKQGNPPTFPSLVNIKQKLNKEQVGKLLVTGRNVMPNFSHLADSERNAIIGFLFGESTFSSEITELTSVENGKNLFTANCTRCHNINSENLTSNNQGRWGMKPPFLGGIGEKYKEDSFKRILNMGPWYMPSFFSLPDKSKEDIYAYLNTFKYDYSKSRYTSGGRSCRMNMR